jgi:purine catabolism regulator
MAGILVNPVGAERGQMPGTIVEFDDRPGDRISSLLPSSEAASVAGARLSTVLGTDDGRQLLRLAAIWLEHNGQWEQAAQQAGMHRHSLKARIDRLGGILRLSLDRFDDRAELWMMLTALGLRDRD